MAAMQPAAPSQFPNLSPPSGPCLPQPPATPVHQEKVVKPCLQAQSDSFPPKEPAASPSQPVPRLRAVVESQAFKNILVDEMDMMVSRAATVIQASWKGYRLRQKLISQMTAAKAIQEAWRRFSTRRLMRSNKLNIKRPKKEEEEKDIPYHPPQQVRFHAPEDQPPVMVSKETQFPSSDNLVPSHTAAASGPSTGEVHRGSLLPQPPVTCRLVGPKNLPCVLTKTVRNACFIRHLEGDGVKSRLVTSKTIKSGTQESAALGRYGQVIHGSLKTQTQVHTEADVAKVPPPHMYLVNKTPIKVCPVTSVPKSPATVAPAPKGAPPTNLTSPATTMKMQSPTSPTSPAHIQPNSLLSSNTPKVRPVVPVARAQPPGYAVTSTAKTSPRLVPVSKGPLQTGPGPMMAKTSPQMRPGTRSQPQTYAASSSSRGSSQSSPTAKPSPQTRLAAMLTKTPAQIRSVAAVLRTLCLPPSVAAASPRGSPQTPAASDTLNTPSLVHLNSPKAKVSMSAKQTAPMIKVVSRSYMGEEKGRCGPHGHPDTVAPKLTAKSPLEVEKVKPGPPRVPKKEAAPKTNTAIVTRALSWTKVTEDRSKSFTQTQQKAEVVRVHSRVYLPEEMTVTLSQAQMAVPLMKASSQAQPPHGHSRPPPASPLSKAVTSSGLATGPPEGRPPVGPSAALSSSPLAAHLMSLTAQLQPAGEQARSASRAHPALPHPVTTSLQARSPGITFIPPEGYPHTCPLTPTPRHHTASHQTKSSSQTHPPAEQAKTTNTKTTKAICHVCPPSKLSKAPSLAQLITCLAKVPPQAHLPVGLTKAQSQAQLASETAKGLLAAHPTTDLSSKTQSQPLLGTSKASVQFWQHFGTLNPGPRAKTDDSIVTKPQLHSHAQHKAMQSTHSVTTDPQGMLVPVLTPPGHSVCNAESWGDSGRARTSPPPPLPSQAVSGHEDLAAAIASLCADLVAMLGSPEDLRTLLAKTLSQGEVRTALSQALSREVLGPSVVKALPQGMLGMALMKVLSWGELGISLSRALSRGELRPELSKATQGKLAEILCKSLTEDERTTLSQALCQGELGAVFTQSLAQMAQRTGAFLPKATSKAVGSQMSTAPAPVEVTCSGSLSVAWGPALGPIQARCSKVRPPGTGLIWGQSDGILWGKGDGVTLEGSPCSPQSPIGSFSGAMVTGTYQCPLLSEPAPSRGERHSVLCSGLYPRPLNLDPMACGEGPQIPKRPSHQPPPCLWQPIVANGAGPSSNQPSVTGNTTPSSRQPPVASRVSYPWVPYRENVTATKYSSGLGGKKYPTSQRSSAGAAVCQCPNPGMHKLSPCGSSVVKSRSPPPEETLRHRLVSPLGDKEMITVVRDVEEQPQGRSSSVHLDPKLQNVSSTSAPQKERRPHGSPTSSHPRDQAAGHHMSLLNELLATFPQHPQIVLAKSYPRGAAASYQSNSASRSSQQSSASASVSTLSSLTPSEVLEHFREGDWLEECRSVLRASRELGHRPQEQLEKTGPVDSPHTDPQFQQQPLEPGSLLFHRSSLALHWESDSGSDYSTGDMVEGMSQNVAASWRRMSYKVQAGDLQPSEVTQLDATLFQDALADGRTPSPGQAPEAREGPQCLNQLLETTGLCAISPQPAGSRTVSPSLVQPSVDTGVAPSLVHPSVATRVFPTLAQPSMGTGVSPTLTEPLMYYGLPTNLSQSLLYYRGSPICTQPHMTSEAPSNFTQTPGTGVVALGNQAVSSTGVVSSQVQGGATIAPRATQAPVGSWPTPGCSSMPAHGAGHPDTVQASVATGVSPDFFMPYNMPSNFTQPYMGTLVTPNFVQPPMPHCMTPNLTQPFVVSIMSPTLTHAQVPDGASPNLSQPATASGVVPGMLQVPLSNRVPSSLGSPLLAPGVRSHPTQASVATLGALSLLPPTVVCGVGHGSSKVALDPQQHAHADSSTGQCQPSVVLGGSSSCVMSRSGQPSLGVFRNPGDRLVIDTRSQRSPQDPTVHSESTQGSKGSVAQHRAPARDGGLALGTSVPCQTWLRGIAPGTSQGPVATGLFLSMCQGDNPPPMAAWTLPANVPWTQEQASVTTGVGQGPCPAVMPSVQVPSEFFPNQLGTSFPQTCAPLPAPRDPQLLSMVTVVPSSCQYARVVIPDAAGGGLVQSSVDGKVIVAKNNTLNLPQGSVIRGVGKYVPPESKKDDVAQSVPPESKKDGVAQSVPPESMVDGVAQSIPPESKKDGVAQSVPPESMVDGVAQSVPPESKKDGVAQSVPPEPMVDGVAQSIPPESMVDGVAQSVPKESMVDGVAQSIPPESKKDGVAQSVPPESMVDGVAQSVPPESMVDVKAQNLPPEAVVSGEVQSLRQDPVANDVALNLSPCSVASTVPPSHPQEMDGEREKLSSAVESLPSSRPPGPGPGFVASGTGPSMPLGSVASSVPPASMLVGISPRPYQPQSRVSFLTPHVTSLANAHPLAPAVQRVSQDQRHLPTVLSNASQFSQDPGRTKLVDVDNLTLLKPRQMDEAVISALESGIDPAKCEGPEMSPWTGLRTKGAESRERETLAAENIPKDPAASMEEAPTPVSGVTPVPAQAPSLGERPKANSIASVQPSSSGSNSGPHSLHLASRVPSLQEAPVADSPSRTLASSTKPVTGSPQLSLSIAGTAKLPPGLEVSTGNPIIPQGSERTDSAPPIKNRASSVSRMGDPQNHGRRNHQEPFTAKTPHCSVQGSLVSELLEGSMDRLLPFSSPPKPMSQVSSDKPSSGTRVLGITPRIHSGDRRGQKAPSGVQAVSLTYRPSPNGSRRPLLNEAAHDTSQPKPVVALTAHPDQRPPLGIGPHIRQDGDRQTSPAPQSHKHQYVTDSKTSFDEGPRKVPPMLHGHRLQHVPVPKTRTLSTRSQVPNTLHSKKTHVTDLRTGFGRVSQVYTTPHGHKPYVVRHPNKISPPPTVPQGPVDQGLAAGQSWNSKVPSVSVRAPARAWTPPGPWQPSRGHRPWDPSGAEAALDHKPSAELLVSVRAMEKVVQAIVTIQACARGYLVRRTVKVWHQWATIIQATWRGYRVRRNLARLLRATTIIQATWRGYSTRRDRALRVLLPTLWLEPRDRAQLNSDPRNRSEHRCFLSCQPDVCSVCRSLGPRAESPPSVVMLVGSQPRTCHVCGHTLSTRVVQGFGQGVSGKPGSRWAPQQHPLLSQQHRAATIIQAAWKGYRIRRRLSQQQSAAKTVQATWRGHYTRSCLTTDALLGTGGPWNISRETSQRRASRAYALHWPGV